MRCSVSASRKERVEGEEGPGECSCWKESRGRLVSHRGMILYCTIARPDWTYLLYTVLSQCKFQCQCRCNTNRLRVFHVCYHTTQLHTSRLAPPLMSDLIYTASSHRPPNRLPPSPSFSFCSSPNAQPLYPIVFRKFASLIPALRLSRIAFVSSSLAPAAFTAPSSPPSPAGKSIVCSYSGTLGASSSGFMACSLRSRLAATRRCFFDFAVKKKMSAPNLEKRKVKPLLAR